MGLARGRGSENQPPYVCILLATFNGQNFIAEQLLSLAAQMGVNIEIVIRDDGSIDDTLAVIEDIKSKSGLNIIVLNDNRGFSRSAGRNFIWLLQAIQISRYDYVAFCDQDDIWASTKLIRAIQSLIVENAHCYSSNLIAFDQLEGRGWSLPRNERQVDYDYLFQSASAGCTYVLSASAARIVQDKCADINLDPCFIPSHDWLIYAICRSNGLRWIADNQSHIFYRQHSANVFGALPGPAGVLHRMKLIRSGWFGRHVRVLWDVITRSEGEARIYAALKRYSWADRIWLASRVASFRRRRRDQIFLAFCFLMGWV